MVISLHSVVIIEDIGDAALLLNFGCKEYFTREVLSDLDGTGHVTGDHEKLALASNIDFATANSGHWILALLSPLPLSLIIHTKTTITKPEGKCFLVYFRYLAHRSLLSYLKNSLFALEDSDC